MLQHAGRTVAKEPAGRGVTRVTERRAADAAPAIVREYGAPGDQLGRLLRVAVERRAADTDVRLEAPLLQRFYDPAQVAGSEVAAADYVWGQGPAIAKAYLPGRHGAQDTKQGRHNLVRRTYTHMLSSQAGPQPPGAKAWSNRLAEDLAAGTRKHWQTLVSAPNALRTFVLSVAVRALNVLEQDTATEQAAQIDLSTNVLIGTEFTFTNAAIRGTEPGTSDAVAKDKVKEWAEVIAQDKSLIAKVDPVAGKADKGTDKKNARKFTYSLGGGRTWAWVLDIDPGCLETQTAPTSQADLNAVRRIITSHIFGKLQDLDLTVDPTARGGGGHISFDMATMFGTSAELLLAVLTELQAAASQQRVGVVAWGEQFDYVDAPNAPWLADQGVQGDRTRGAALREFGTLVAGLKVQLEQGRIQIGDVAQQLNTFHTQLVNPWATDAKTHKKPTKSDFKGSKNANEQLEAALREYSKEQTQADNVLAHPGHYQAVNVEHLAAADASTRRLELRAIGAQTSFQNLLQHLAYIYGRITAARSAVESALDARRTTFTGS